MPIIYRPDYLADAISQNLTAESIKQQREHDEDVARRHQQQRNTAIGVGAGVGLAGGLALGGASLAAGGTIPGTTLPALGTLTVPTAAIVPGLTGAALGGQIGQQIEAQDYVGALGTAAQTAKLGVDYSENQRIYGYQPTAAGRASVAAIALKAGTTIDALQNAPGTMPQKLAAAQAAASDREIGEEFYKTLAHKEAMDEGIGLRLAAEDALNNIPGYDFVPDDAAIQGAQVGPGSLAAIDDDVALYKQSGGTAGATYPEMKGSLESVGRQIRTGGRGRRQRKPQEILPPMELGPNDRITPNQPFFVGDELKVAEIDQHGKLNWKQLGTRGRAWENSQLPVADRQAASRAELLAHNIPEAELGNYHIGKDGIPEPNKDFVSESEARQKYLAEIRKPNKDGEIISSEEFSSARAMYDQTTRETKVVDEVYAAHEQLGAMTPDRASELYRRFRATVTNPDPAVSNMMSDITQAAQRNALVARMRAMSMGGPARQFAVPSQETAPEVAPAQEQAVPPPGSAASAESAGRAAAKVAKAVPGAIASVPKAGFEVAGKGAKGVTEAGVGFFNELFGFPAKGTPQEEYARQFADTQKRNIEAGIDDTVVAINAAGNVRPYEKRMVTPELMAELKQAGFIFPGLEGD